MCVWPGKSDIEIWERKYIKTARSGYIKTAKATTQAKANMGEYNDFLFVRNRHLTYADADF